MAAQDKLDGYRMAARIDNGRVQLLTPNGSRRGGNRSSDRYLRGRVHLPTSHLDAARNDADFGVRSERKRQ
jgi:hypothetical protein